MEQPQEGEQEEEDEEEWRRPAEGALVVRHDRKEQAREADGDRARVPQSDAAGFGDPAHGEVQQEQRHDAEDDEEPPDVDHHERDARLDALLPVQLAAAADGPDGEDDQRRREAHCGIDSEAGVEVVAVRREPRVAVLSPPGDVRRRVVAAPEPAQAVVRYHADIIDPP